MPANAMHVTRYRPQAGLGDVVADLEAFASLAASAGSPGGISGWMQGQIAQFNALPAVVANIQNIIQTLNASLTSVGVVPATVPGLVAAQTDLGNISAQYPTVQQGLVSIGVILYPALAGGGFGLNTIAQLTQNGGDVLSTFNGMQQLFSYRDDARTQLIAAAANPALPPTVAQQVTAALNNLGQLSSPQAGIGKLILYGVGAVVAYKLIRKVV